MDGSTRVGALFVSLLLLHAPLARAQAPVDDPTVAAAEASEVRDQYCTDASNDAITLEAEGTARVSAVWARVSRSYDAHQEAYLLYWRGLLGQCIGKLDRVQEDLEAFIGAVGGDAAYSDQVRDAQRRLRRVQVQTQSEQQNRGPLAGVGIGIGLGAGAGVLGGLAGWQASELTTLTADFHSGDLFTAQYPDYEARATLAADASNGLTAAAIAAGVAGVTVAIVTGGIASDRASVAIVPTHGGVAMAIGGRW